MTPWINLSQVPAVFVSSCWAATDGFEAVSPWQLRKSPAAREDFTALGFSHVIEVLRHSELGSCQGHPSHLVGSCPAVFLLCFVSVQQKEVWNPQSWSLWVCLVWMNSPCVCFKVVPSRICSLNDANLQLDSESFERIVEEKTSSAYWKWQLSLLLVLNFVSSSIFNNNCSDFTHHLVLNAFGGIQRTCLGDLFWDYKDS